MDLKEHWENVFKTKRPSEVSWYTPHLEHSLRWIRGEGLQKTAEIIDVGAGESTLIDDLLADGFTHLTALDLSASALAEVRHRLGAGAQSVTWVAGDVTEITLPEHHYDLWHDRAVFHFLVEQVRRERYVNEVKRALKAGGRILISTFGPEGPTRCSGLEVHRYDKDSLVAAFGEGFTLEDSELLMHETPTGKLQQFLCARFTFSGRRP
ncbi:class I SAM-dependent methyltransferase [Terriglobus albidus]|uniref:Class I SAM-dependent methyltransferase n=1 Tax=Terriglobus albidus TaxID=1592106 RepID=A0A5B9E9Y7_9BACT|nr:class I SAM-dependent methyltransferase [Terriglobus albidus]QEE29043.1 class I SAM-dependent methyltransferase [Terriglobus albidus]